MKSPVTGYEFGKRKEEEKGTTFGLKAGFLKCGM
jgi:hypothetical protein